MECRICNGNCSKRITLNGSLFGTTGNWLYYKCENCGCLQIKEVPENIADFYKDNNYYSLNSEDRSIRSWLWDQLFDYQLRGKNILGFLIEIASPSNYKFIREFGKSASILDVGCGDGKRLRQLQRYGFLRLFGLEPYIDNDINYNNVHIYKGDLLSNEIPSDTKFDLIILEHSLEHIYDQRNTLLNAKNLLSDGGKIVIKIPQFSRYYWHKFSKFQYDLDPPRHFYIHTYKSIEYLSRTIGMHIIDYTTETEPVMYLNAYRLKKRQSAAINNNSMIILCIIGLLSLPIRILLNYRKDGAYATFVLQKV